MWFIHNKKGFTMVELVIVIAIMGIVFTAISSFLINNIKTFHRAEDQIHTQHNAQSAINIIVDNIMGAKGIQSLIPYEGNSIKNVIFTITDSEGNNKYVEYSFDKSNKTLSWGQGSNWAAISTHEYAKNIKDFEIIKIMDGAITQGVEIKIIAELNDSETILKNQVYFRNAEN